MKLERAEAALALYLDDEIGADDDETFTADLITDLMHLVREEGGSDAVMRVYDRIERDLRAEPESASDFRQLAEYNERQGHTSMAAKLYEHADDLEGTA